MSLGYLISNRTKPRVGSHEWFRTWAKRMLQAPSLAAALSRESGYRRKGARVGVIVTFSGGRFLGSLRHLSVGDFTSIGLIEAQLLAPLTIGRCVVINDGVRLITGTHDVDSPDFALRTAPITIGDYAWICTGAMILPGVSIGAEAVVAAGAIVTRDVPNQAVVGGNPARVIKMRAPRESLHYRPSALRACVECWIR